MALKRIYHPSAADPAVIQNSWWEASANAMRHSPAPIQNDVDCDIAIIGGGYTGLNAAKYLAKAGQNVCVCEAGHIGWGASGRNGGFCANMSTKQSLGEIAAKYGIEDTRAAVHVQEEAIDQIREFYTDAGLEIHTPDKNAELAAAHSQYQLSELHEESKNYKRILGIKIPVFEKEKLIEIGAGSPSFYGGMILPWGFGIHPLNYLRSLADAAIDTGATISAHTEVQSISRNNGQYILSTKIAEIRAKKIIIATNGYTAENIPSWSKGRLLPAVSSILVTRPITAEEQQRQGWTTRHMTYDTRTLLHYFRLLPDGRMMFGGRGANSGDPTEQKSFFKELRRQFEDMFPEWTHVQTDYQWAGFVCLNRKKSQFLGPIDTDNTAWASLAYHGSGVAMASWSGKTLAQMVLGDKKQYDLPRLYTSPVHKFPFDFLRPQYLKLAYAYYRQKDKR